MGGLPNGFGWVEMIQAVGIHLAARQRNRIIDGDAGPAGWLLGAAQEEQGHMNDDGGA